MQISKKPYESLIDNDHLLSVYRDRFEWLPVFNGEPPVVVFMSDPDGVVVQYDLNLNRLFVNVAGSWFGDVVDWMRRGLQPYCKRRSVAATASVLASLQGVREFMLRAMMQAAKEAVYRMEEIRVPHNEIKSVLDRLTSIDPHFEVPELLHALREAQSNLRVVSAPGQYLPHTLIADIAKGPPPKSVKEAADEIWEKSGLPLWRRRSYAEFAA